MNFSPLSLSEVARRRKALQPQPQPFSSPELVDLTSPRDQIDEDAAILGQEQ